MEDCKIKLVYPPQFSKITESDMIKIKEQQIKPSVNEQDKAFTQTVNILAPYPEMGYRTGIIRPGINKEFLKEKIGRVKNTVPEFKNDNNNMVMCFYIPPMEKILEDKNPKMNIESNEETKDSNETKNDTNLSQSIKDSKVNDPEKTYHERLKEFFLEQFRNEERKELAEMTEAGANLNLRANLNAVNDNLNTTLTGAYIVGNKNDFDSKCELIEYAQENIINPKRILQSDSAIQSRIFSNSAFNRGSDSRRGSSSSSASFQSSDHNSDIDIDALNRDSTRSRLLSSFDNMSTDNMRQTIIPTILQSTSYNYDEMNSVIHTLPRLNDIIDYKFYIAFFSST